MPIATRPAGRNFGVGIAVSLVVAGGLSLFASVLPDGLESVGAKLGCDGAAKSSAAASRPLADWGDSGIGNAEVSGALAGIIGVLVTIVVGLAIAKLASLRANRAS